MGNSRSVNVRGSVEMALEEGMQMQVKPLLFLAATVAGARIVLGGQLKCCLASSFWLRPVPNRAIFRECSISSNICLAKTG